MQINENIGELLLSDEDDDFKNATKSKRSTNKQEPQESYHPSSHYNTYRSGKESHGSK